MKTFLITSLALLLSATSFAQAQTGFSFSVASNNVILKFTIPEQEYKTESVLGQSLCFVVSIPIKNKFSLETGVAFNRSGVIHKINYNDEIDFGDYKAFVNSRGKNTFKLNYLEIPLLVNYQTDFGLMFSVGSSFARGISGKVTRDISQYVTYDVYSERKTIYVDDKVDVAFVNKMPESRSRTTPYFRSWNMMMKFRVGYRYKNVRLTPELNLGFVNMEPDLDGPYLYDPKDYSTTSISYGFNFTCFFRQKTKPLPQVENTP